MKAVRGGGGCPVFKIHFYNMLSAHPLWYHKPFSRPASEYSSPSGRPLSCVVDENTPVMTPVNGAEASVPPGEQRVQERRVRSQRHRNYMSRTHLHTPPDLPEGYGESSSRSTSALSESSILFLQSSHLCLPVTVCKHFPSLECYWLFLFHTDIPTETKRRKDRVFIHWYFSEKFLAGVLCSNS